MKGKISILKLNIIILLVLWFTLGVSGIAASVGAEGALLYLAYGSSFALSWFYCFRKYKPVVKECAIHNGYMMCGGRYIFDEDIRAVYQINVLEKVIFAIICPDCDYTSSFSKNAFIINTSYDRYLIDCRNTDFIKRKIVRTVESNARSTSIFYMLLVLPVLAAITVWFWGIDPLWYALPILIIIYIVIPRLAPPFHLGEKINTESLPVSPLELKEFKNISIIKGFVFTDIIPILPFKKPVRLEGLAVDIVVKKYIILNPRLFNNNCPDYLRFVLFHELSHIKNRDSSKPVIAVAIFSALDLMYSMLPEQTYSIIYKAFPYADYGLAFIVLIYFIFVYVTRKNIEMRADRQGIEAIGEDGVSRVYERTGIKLK